MKKMGIDPSSLPTENKESDVKEALHNCPAEAIEEVKQYHKGIILFYTINIQFINFFKIN